jgi:hypothetical protein
LDGVDASAHRNYRSAVTHYAEIILADESMTHEEAVLELMGALTEHSADWGEAGMHYGVWAGLHDIGDAFDDPQTSGQAVRDAAAEWLHVADARQEAEWLARWNDWLGQYQSSHQTRFGDHWPQSSG